MADAWVHALIDLIAYGRPYFDLHKGKDELSKQFGRHHRKARHEWYQAFGKTWSLDDPFPSCFKDRILRIGDLNGPEKAEERMAYTDHDYIDRIWGTLSNSERKYREGFFIWITLNPKILKEWAGVDVLKGKIHRVIDGCEIWEYCPELKSEYRRLCKYIQTVKDNDETLKGMIERYG